VKGLRERLEHDVVLGAEGYLFELERRGYLKSGPYVPEVVLDFPDAVRELHREFLRAGAEVMVAFTYYGHREKLRMIGREDDLEPLNRQALRLAKEAAAEGGALVAGNICNTWVFDPEAPESSGEVVREMYREQVAWAKEEGADLVIAETNDYVGEALIAVEVIQEFGLPSVVTFASTEDRTLDGYAFDDACARLEAAGATSSVSTARAGREMLPLLGEIRAAVDCAVAAQPVPYRTSSAQPTFQSLRDSDGHACSRSRSTPSSARASSWRTSPSRPETPACTTSASAAAALRITSVRWRRAWVAPSRRVGTRPT
jgi:betaine-homocysteine S-methyltransferase